MCAGLKNASNGATLSPNCEYFAIVIIVRRSGCTRLATSLVSADPRGNTGGHTESECVPPSRCPRLRTSSRRPRTVAV